MTPASLLSTKRQTSEPNLLDTLYVHFFCTLYIIWSPSLPFQDGDSVPSLPALPQLSVADGEQHRVCRLRLLPRAVES